jgi:hypothetical protein
MVAIRKDTEALIEHLHGGVHGLIPHAGFSRLWARRIRDAPVVDLDTFITALQAFLAEDQVG